MPFEKASRLDLTDRLADHPLLTIQNQHVDDCGPTPVIPKGDMLQYFENQHGEQWVFVGWRNGDGGGETAHLYAGELGWTEIKLTRSTMAPDAVLREEEVNWLINCWAALCWAKRDDIAKEYRACQKVFAITLAKEAFQRLRPEMTAAQIDREVDKQVKRMFG